MDEKSLRQTSRPTSRTDGKAPCASAPRWVTLASRAEARRPRTMGGPIAGVPRPRAGTPGRRRAGRRGVALFAAVVALGGGAASAAASDTGDTPLPAAITDIMAKPQYADATWGLLELDPSGAPVRSRRADEMFIPGSTTKLFSVSAAWKLLGPDHTFTTPVYALGHRLGGTLDGNLVL